MVNINDNLIIGASPVTKPTLFIGKLSRSIFRENLENSNPFPSSHPGHYTYVLSVLSVYVLSMYV